MANEALVAAIKQIVTRSRGGDLDQAYLGYKELFSAPAFTSYRPEDQRQALRLMILAKNAPRTPTPAMVEAHRAAVPCLTELVSSHMEPADHEMLGSLPPLLGNEASRLQNLPRRARHRARRGARARISAGS